MRSLARDCVYKFLFSRLFNPSDEGLFEVLTKELSDEDKKFAKSLLDCAVKDENKYLSTINELSNGYSIDRVHNTDKISLIIGMAELDNFKDTPIPVVIDEAVNLSAKYSGDNSTDFVNGILGEFVKRNN